MSATNKKDVEIAHLQRLLSKAYGQLLAVEWEVDLGVLAEIEEYCEGKEI